MVRPNPVPFSGQPITDVATCAGSKNTWFYEHEIQETAGVAVTFTTETHRFDGAIASNRTGLNISVPARGSVKMNRRWCSSSPSGHTTQTTMTGTDANGNAVTLTGPDTTLMAR